MSDLERAFATYWRLLGNGQEPEREVQFHPSRRWRFDFCWPEAKVAVELQGATWARGRHTRGAGYRNDCEKLDEAQALGWRVFWLTRGMLEDDPATAIGWIKEAIEDATD